MTKHQYVPQINIKQKHKTLIAVTTITNKQAMQARHVDFICTPLVVDYLRLKFSAGLPNPFRESKWRREHGRVDRNLARFMLDEDESKLVVYILQGGCADSPRQADANQEA